MAKAAHHKAMDKVTAGIHAEHKGAKPNAKAPLGEGGRFAALKEKIAQEPGVRDPGAVAAAIGRKKYGAAKMGKMAVAGKKC